VNDDPFLDLFALDLPDLTFCGPDLSLVLDLSLPDPHDPFHPLHPANPLCPTGGGWPNFWDNIDDIIGAGWDLLKSIGEVAKDIIEAIWNAIGGTVRWLYNQVESFSWWVWKQVEHWGGVVRNAVVDIGGWVWHQVEYWGGVAVNAVVDSGQWVWHQVEHWGGVAVNAVVDSGQWVWHQVEHWGGVAVNAVVDSGQWVWDQVEHWGGVVREAVEDSADWIVKNILPPIMGAAQGIGSAITDAFGDFVEMVQKALGDLKDMLVDAIKWPWEHLAEPFIDTIQFKLAIPGKLMRGEYSSFPQLIDDMLDPAPIVLAGAFGLLLLMMLINYGFQISTQTFVTPMALPYLQATQARVGAELLTIGVVQEALNRGFIDEATADDHLSRMGYSGSAKKALLELRNLLPGPSDLIHMAVREVFNPKLREELTLDAEFPDAFLPWARKLGYSEEWARNYWADHWDLPSPSQGYEMLHRGEIEMPQLVDLIKALDYAPVWRDKLINIAYNPITRVDLRRLYKNKIITEEEVFKGYKAQGYNDENARYLTDFTKQFYSPDDKSQLDDMADLAASTFRTAYRRHVISRDEALDKIVDAGYTEEVADFLLAIDDAQLALNPTTESGVAVRDLTVPIIRTAYAEKFWDRARAQQELEALGYLAWEADLLLQLEDLAQQRELAGLQETIVKEQYLARTIDRAAASAQLDKLKVIPERRDLLLQRWDLQGAQKPHALTVAQLQQAYRADLISDTDLLSRLAGMGYNDPDAKTIVDLTDTTTEGRARRLSVAQLQKAYKIGAISDAQLLNGLLGLGYSQEDAQVLIDIATPEPAAKERQLSAGQLSTGFRAGLVTEAELLEKLTGLGYAQADAELLRDIAAPQIEAPARRLSVAQLKESYKADLLDRQGLLVELLDLGYTDRDAGWLQTLIAPEE